MTDTTRAIEAFFARHKQAFGSPATEHDPAWPSPCETGEPFTSPHSGASLIAWEPVARSPLSADFDGLENALEMTIHPDIKAHYGTYWSGNLYARASDGELCLLYLWSPDDAERLIENLIGHAVACRRNKTPFAVFFAVTEPDGDYYLTVNNDTGAVQLEAPGQGPLRVLADSLAQFLDSLEPCAGPKL